MVDKPEGQTLPHHPVDNEAENILREEIKRISECQRKVNELFPATDVKTGSCPGIVNTANLRCTLRYLLIETDSGLSCKVSSGALRTPFSCYKNSRLLSADIWGITSSNIEGYVEVLGVANMSKITKMNGANCAEARITKEVANELHLGINTTIPRWRNPARGCRNRWQEFEQKILAHERVHIRHNIEFFEWFKKTIVELPPATGCLPPGPENIIPEEYEKAVRALALRKLHQSVSKAYLDWALLVKAAGDRFHETGQGAPLNLDCSCAEP